MTVYFKRTVQGRIHDATYYMAGTVNSLVSSSRSRGITADSYIGNVYVQYEPYYSQSQSERIAVDDQETRLLSSFGSSSGIFLSAGITVTNTTTNGTQARPGAAQY